MSSLESHFTQQTLPGILPICTSLPLLVLSIVIAIFFLSFGIAYSVQSRGLFTQEIVYSNNGSSASGAAVTKSFTLSKPVSGPVYVFYLLTGVYQNHRRFVTSRSYPQLRSGTKLSNSEWKGFLFFLLLYIYWFYSLAACDYRIKEGQNVEREDYCGIAYASRFNDTLREISKCDDAGDSCVPFSIDTHNIITSSDKVSSFSHYSVVL